MRVERLSAWEFPLTEPANYYFVEVSGKRLLIDAGPKPSPSIKTVPNLVLLTHWHWDHTMGLAGLGEARVCASDITLKILSNVDNIKRSALTPIQAMGLNRDPQVEMLMASMFGRYATIVSALARTDRYTLDECTAELSKHNIRIIECPGHTLDHVCYIVDGGLFSGDTILPNTSPTTIDFGQYLETLARLSAEEWMRLYPGHGDPAERPSLEDYLKSLYRGKVARLARIAAILSGEWVSFNDLLRTVYGVEPGIEAYVAARTLIGYLKFLEDLGLATVDRGVSPWRVRITV